MSASLSAKYCIAIARIGTGGAVAENIGKDWIETYRDGVYIKGHTYFILMDGGNDYVVAEFTGEDPKILLWRRQNTTQIFK